MKTLFSILVKSTIIWSLVFALFLLAFCVIQHLVYADVYTFFAAGEPGTVKTIPPERLQEFGKDKTVYLILSFVSSLVISQVAICLSALHKNQKEI